MGNSSVGLENTGGGGLMRCKLQGDMLGTVGIKGETMLYKWLHARYMFSISIISHCRVLLGRLSENIFVKVLCKLEKVLIIIRYFGCSQIKCQSIETCLLIFFFLNSHSQNSF